MAGFSEAFNLTVSETFQSNEIVNIVADIIFLANYFTFTLIYGSIRCNTFTPAGREQHFLSAALSSKLTALGLQLWLPV